MISRTLARRLEELEARLAPAGKPWTKTVRLIDKDGNVRSVYSSAAPRKKTLASEVEHGGRKNTWYVLWDVLFL